MKYSKKCKNTILSEFKLSFDIMKKFLPSNDLQHNKFWEDSTKSLFDNLMLLFCYAQRDGKHTSNHRIAVDFKISECLYKRFVEDVLQKIDLDLKNLYEIVPQSFKDNLLSPEQLREYANSYFQNSLNCWLGHSFNDVKKPSRSFEINQHIAQ